MSSAFRPGEGAGDAGSSPEEVGATSVSRRATDAGLDRRSVVARQEEHYGGIKVGSAFFGWLTATGLAVLLIALATAAGVAFSLANGTTAADVAGSVAGGTSTAQTIGLASGVLLLVILFVSYFCGGYVAGRMARFAGTRQGLAVWLWGLVVAVVVAVLGALAGSSYDILARLNLPRIPLNEGTLTRGGWVAVAAVLLTTLVGALLGGKAGMAYHRKVDRAGQPD